MSTYHIYYGDKPIFRDLAEDDFHFIWEKLMWVYNDELTYVELTTHPELIEASF